MTSLKLRVPVWLLTAIVALPQLCETVYTPALVALAVSFGVSINSAEQTLTIFLLGFALGVFVWGIASDIIGRRAGLILGISLHIIASIGCFFTSSITWFLVLRFVQGFGASTGSVLGQAVARDCTEAHERGKLFSLVSAALAFAPAVGFFLGGLVLEYAEWRNIFLGLAVLGLALLGAVYFLLPETKPAITETATFQIPLFKRMYAIITDPFVLTSGMIIGALNGMLFGFFAEAPSFFNLLLGEQESGFAFAVVSATVLPLALGGLASRFLLARGWSSHIIVNLGIGIMAFAAILLCVGSTNMWAVLLGIGCTMIGCTMIIPNVLAHALEKYRVGAGSAASVFGLYYYLIASAGTGLMGWLHNGTTTALGSFFMISVFFLIVAQALRCRSISSE